MMENGKWKNKKEEENCIQNDDDVKHFQQGVYKI